MDDRKSLRSVHWKIGGGGTRLIPNPPFRLNRVQIVTIDLSCHLYGFLLSHFYKTLKHRSNKRLDKEQLGEECKREIKAYKFKPVGQEGEKVKFSSLTEMDDIIKDT